MVINLSLTKEEMDFVTNYAKNKSSTIEEIIKEALFEKIEDELDLTIAKDAYRQYQESNYLSKPINELFKNL